MTLQTKPRLFEPKFVRVLQPWTWRARSGKPKTQARNSGALKRLPSTALKAVACLTLCLATTACSSLGKINNAQFLVMSLEATKTPKPKQCDKTPPPTDYPVPRGVHLRSGTDIADQGVAYGDAYTRGKDFHTDREDKHDVFWSACDKEYAAALERWEANEAARLAAVTAARKLLD